jgi:hypothetical protein
MQALRPGATAGHALDRMLSRSSFSNLVEEEAPIFDRLSGRITD